MKKGLIIITIFLCIIGIKANALMTQEPTRAAAYIKNLDGNGGSWLSNNNPQQNQINILDKTWDMVFNYNDNRRFQSLYVYYDWEQIFGNKVLEFELIYSRPTNTSDPTPLWLNSASTEDINNNYVQCSTDSVSGIEYNSGKYYLVKFRCPITTKLLNINMEFKSINNLYNMDYLFYINNDLYIRDTTEEELAEIQESIRISNSQISQLLRDQSITWEHAQEHWEEITPNGTWGGIIPENTWEEATHQLEDTLFAYRQYENWTNTEVSLDSNASSWIWTTATNIINSNVKVWGMVTSALGICLIRLVLG